MNDFYLGIIVGIIITSPITCYFGRYWYGLIKLGKIIRLQKQNQVKIDPDVLEAIKKADELLDGVNKTK